MNLVDDGHSGWLHFWPRGHNADSDVQSDIPSSGCKSHQPAALSLRIPRPGPLGIHPDEWNTDKRDNGCGRMTPKARQTRRNGRT